MSDQFSGKVKKGEVRNPTGKGGFAERREDINRTGLTREAARAMHAAAEASALAKERMAEALLEEVMTKGATSEVVGMIRPEINAFLKEAIDRIAGTAKASVDLSSEDGSMSPKPNRIELVAPDSDDDS